MILPRFAILLILFMWTAAVSGEEGMSTEALLQAALETSRQKEQFDAIMELTKRPPEARIVQAAAIVLSRESSDHNVPLAAGLVISTQLRQEPNLRAPPELVAALRSTPEIRERATEALSAFRCFDTTIVPELLEQIEKDDFVFVRLSNSFTDIPRLQRLTGHSDVNVRSIALSRIWSATHDLDVYLPLFLQAQCIRLPSRTEEKSAAIQLEVEKLEKIVAQLTPNNPVVAAIEQRIRGLENEPALREKNFFDLSYLGRAMAAHKLTTERPVESGMVLARTIDNHREATCVRTMAATILGSIAKADNNDRMSLVDFGAVKLVQKCLETETDDDLKRKLRTCIALLNTPHQRTRAKSGANEPKNPDETKVPDIFAPEPIKQMPSLIPPN